jgi:hypothetical protein
VSADCEVLCFNYSCTYRVQEMTQIKTISDMYKNVKGYFFFRLSVLLVVCTNHSFKWRGYEEMPTVLGPLVDQFSYPVQEECSLYIPECCVTLP